MSYYLSVKWFLWNVLKILQQKPIFKDKKVHGSFVSHSQKPGATQMSVSRRVIGAEKSVRKSYKGMLLGIFTDLTWDNTNQNDSYSHAENKRSYP